jgi:uncharacterized protein YecE (DUF72 family)
VKAVAQYIVGTSGWHYDDWKVRFYPEKLLKSKWLEFYASQFSTVELNNTFYRLPSEKAFRNWYDSTPTGFIFAVKISRFITHVKRLNDTREALRNFMSRAALLKDKLGPVLYQLPPGLRRDDVKLEKFLSDLPKGYKHVLEFRHESWLTDEVYDILRRYHVGICVFDMPGLSCPLLATDDFAYIRFHGKDSLYSSSYTDVELADWAENITELAENLDTVYIYFNNDVQGYALKNAETMRELLSAG